MGWTTTTILTICFVCINLYGLTRASHNDYEDDEDSEDPLGFDEINKQFEEYFVEDLMRSGVFGFREDSEVKYITDNLLKAINIFTKSKDASPLQKKTLMESFASELAELIVQECRNDALSLLEKTETVANALRYAYRQMGDEPSEELIKEVNFLVGVFLNAKEEEGHRHGHHHRRIERHRIEGPEHIPGVGYIIPDDNEFDLGGSGEGFEYGQRSPFKDRQGRNPKTGREGGKYGKRIQLSDNSPKIEYASPGTTPGLVMGPGNQLIKIILPEDAKYMEPSTVVQQINEIIEVFQEGSGETQQVVLPQKIQSLKILSARKKLPSNIQGPKGQAISIKLESSGSTPGIIMGPNQEIQTIVVPKSIETNHPVTVMGPNEQSIKIMLGASGSTPGLVTLSNGNLKKVILPMQSQNVISKSSNEQTIEIPTQAANSEQTSPSNSPQESTPAQQPEKSSTASEPVEPTQGSTPATEPQHSSPASEPTQLTQSPNPQGSSPSNSPQGSTPDSQRSKSNPASKFAQPTVSESENPSSTTQPQQITNIPKSSEGSKAAAQEPSPNQNGSGTITPDQTTPTSQESSPSNSPQGSTPAPQPGKPSSASVPSNPTQSLNPQGSTPTISPQGSTPAPQPGKSSPASEPAQPTQSPNPQGSSSSNSPQGSTSAPQPIKSSPSSEPAA